MCNSYKDFTNNKSDRCEISKMEVVLGTGRVNIPCLMHGNRLCQ